jgi:hypothetical protein
MRTITTAAMTTVQIPTRKALGCPCLLLLCLMLSVALTSAAAQATNSATPNYGQYCNQSKDVREKLISEAQNEQFNVRRVEFLGSEHIRGRELFKRVWMVNEGDIFTRENLAKATKKLSGFSKIFPVTIDDVTVKLDEQDRSIDILFCIRERQKK